MDISSNTKSAFGETDDADMSKVYVSKELTVGDLRTMLNDDRLDAYTDIPVTVHVAVLDGMPLIPGQLQECTVIERDGQPELAFVAKVDLKGRK